MAEVHSGVEMVDDPLELRGDVEAAKSYIEESTRIAREVVGPHSRIIAFDKTYLGDMMRVTGNEAEAERYYLEALGVIGVTPAPEADLRQLLKDDGIEVVRN